MAIIASTLAGIKSDPLSFLGGAERVNACFAHAAHAWRDRLLDPAKTIALFVRQILHGNAAISELRHLSVTDVADSSYCAARARLPLSAVVGLVSEVCCNGSRCIEGATLWLGRRVLMADGTGALTPDTPVLQSQWPQSSSQKPGCGFPAIKLLGLLDLATGMIRHLSIMGLRTQEFSQFGGMHEGMRPGDVLLTEAQFAALPRTLQVRELRYRIVEKGRRTRLVTIATTLLDPMRYPKREIARLYGLRWEIETNFRHLKITMKMDHLKCRTVDGVLKELMIYVLVYNLVRAAMLLAAKRQGVADANRMSFIDALRWITSVLAVQKDGTPPDLIVNRKRVGRSCPRVKKKRMKAYDLMNKPRALYSQTVEYNEINA